MWLKYNFLGNWVELPPTPYFCLFVPKDTALLKDWCRQQTINYVRNSQKSDLVEYNFLSAWCGSKKKEGFPIMGKQAYATSQLPIRHSNSSNSFQFIQFIPIHTSQLHKGIPIHLTHILCDSCCWSYDKYVRKHHHPISVLLMQSSFLTFGSCCENLFVQRKNRFSLEYFPKPTRENPSLFLFCVTFLS